MVKSTDTGTVWMRENSRITGSASLEKVSCSSLSKGEDEDGSEKSSKLKLASSKRNVTATKRVGLKLKWGQESPRSLGPRGWLARRNDHICEIEKDIYHRRD